MNSERHDVQSFLRRWVRNQRKKSTAHYPVQNIEAKQFPQSRVFGNYRLGKVGFSATLRPLHLPVRA